MPILLNASLACFGKADEYINLLACLTSQPSDIASRLSWVCIEKTGRSVVRARVKNLSPSVSSTYCGRITPGVRNAVCRFQTGHDPPCSAMLKLVALKRFVTLPALSTLRKKKGTHR